MNLSRKQWYIAVLVFIFATTAALWGISSLDQSRDTAQDNNTQVQSINWNDTEIADQDDRTLITMDDVPGSIQLNEDAEFGASGPVTGAVLSPDGNRIAFTTGGVAHDGGWVYEIAADQVSPAAFQYGGTVQVLSWSPDGQYVAFSTQSPAPSEHIIVINTDNLDGYLDDVSHQVRVDEEDATDSPASYEFIGWQEPHRLCYRFMDGPEECISADDLIDA